MLGPILFVMFVFDIPKMIKPKFADDTAGIAIGDTITEVEEQLQSHINLLNEWCIDSGMKLNKKKTKVMNLSESNEIINVEVDGTSVEQCKSMVYLGVVLDADLNFDMQVGKDYGIA